MLTGETFLQETKAQVLELLGSAKPDELIFGRIERESRF